jgi:hypothetical protein
LAWETERRAHRAPPTPAHLRSPAQALEEIGKTNFALLNKLNAIATRPPVVGVNKSPPPPARKSRVELEREKRARQIDRENAILLRKLQAVRPAVSGHIYTHGRGAAHSVCAWDTLPAAPPAKAAWVDPSSQAPPPPKRASPPREPRPAEGGGGGGGGAAGGARTRMFKDPALAEYEASREDHLYE